MPRVAFLGLLLLCSTLSTGQDLKPSFKDTIQKYFASENFERIIYYGKQEISNWDDDTLSLDYARVYMALSRSFAALEAYSDAAHYNKQALRIYEVLEDTSGLRTANINLSGIHYYRGDSAKAYQSYQQHLKYLRSDDSEQERLMSNYMKALLTIKFENPRNALAILDSVLPLLHLSKGLSLRVWEDIFKVLDSSQYERRYSSFLNWISSKDSWSVSEKFDSYLFLTEKEIEFGNWLRYNAFRDSLDFYFNSAQGSISDRRKARYHAVKARQFEQNQEYKDAFHNQLLASQYFRKADSADGFEQIERLEAMVEVRSQELRTEQLRKELRAVHFQFNVLIIGLIIILITVFLVYGLYNTARKNSAASKQLALTRGQMISILSHDLRTPLGQLKALLGLINEGALEWDEFKKVMPDLEKQNDLSLELLENTVNWINVNREDFKLNQQEVSSIELQKHIADFFGQQAQKSQIELDFSIKRDSYYTDAFLLKTVLRNLCSNALKFTGAGGKIRFQFADSTTGPLIEVIDSGQGMSEDTIAEIREKYNVSKMGLKSQKGAGLGLLIVQSALDRLGAELKIESKSGEGSTFTIHFVNSKAAL